MLAQPPTKINNSKALLPPLNSEQQAVISSINKPGTFLLHGRTGSGKTRVYQELAIKTVKAKLIVGDLVRISRIKGQFEKGYIPLE